MLRWLGIESVEIKREEPTRPTPGAALDLGTTDDARPRASTVPVLVPRRSASRTPGSTRRALPDGSRAASLLYDGADPRADVPRAARRRSSRRRSAPARSVERLTVDGAPAYWITGAHGFAYQSPERRRLTSDQRLAGNTLLVERADGLLLRIEGALSRERAVEIARSVQ